MYFESVFIKANNFYINIYNLIWLLIMRSKVMIF